MFKALKDHLKLNEIVTKAGFSLYYVGGCVRDIFLLRQPHDYDFATDAAPEQLKEIFKDYPLVNNNGEKHGTITVRLNTDNYEITTFRCDSDYKDHRHPDEVKFTTKLEEDLSRRDFTINAMALDFNGKSYYPDDGSGFNLGEMDLQDKIIRAVGDPMKRFNEDALRILRMVRFASVLNFTIHPDTLDAAWRLRKTLSFVSKERIREELNKIIVGEGFYRLARNYEIMDILAEVLPIKDMFFFNQRNKYHKHDLWLHTLNVVEKANKDYILALASLFHDVGKTTEYQPYELDNEVYYHFKNHPVVSFEVAYKWLQEYKYSNDEIALITFLVQEHDRDVPTKKSLKKFLSLIKQEFEDNYEQVFNYWLELREADKLDHLDIEYTSMETLKQYFDEIVYAPAPCFTLKDLAVNGNDLLNLGFKPSPTIKAVLTDCLNKVLDETLPNDKDLLLDYVRSLKIV